MNKKVLFLASGNGGTVKFLHLAIQKLHLPIEIAALIADRACGASTFAEKNGIPFQIVTYSRSSPQLLQEALSGYEFDVAVTNFHKIIDEGTLAKFPDKFINLHYSLLPAFGAMIGMKTLEAARQANAKFIGTSCHKVSPVVDAGELIGQSVMPVNWQSDSESELITTTFKAACLVFLNVLLAPEASNSSLLLGSKLVQFNPGLSFTTEVFDDSFWSALNSL